MRDDKIPDEIMREAWGVQNAIHRPEHDGHDAVKIIARALMARDKRAAEAVRLADENKVLRAWKVEAMEVLRLLSCYDLNCRCSYADCPWDVDQANEFLAVKNADIARLQEQVETLHKERDAFRACLATASGKLMVAEAERDRRREALVAVLRRFGACVGVDLLNKIDAALQKEPQP